MNLKEEPQHIKRSLKYLRRQKNTELNNKNLWEDADIKMDMLKNENETFAMEVNNLLKHSQNQLNAVMEQIEELKFQLKEFATKKELQALEDRVNNGDKLLQEKINELWDVEIKNRKELDAEIDEIKKELRKIKQNNNKVHDEIQMDDVNSYQRSLKLLQDEIIIMKNQIDEKLNETANKIMKKNENKLCNYEQILNNYKEEIKSNYEAIEEQERANKANRKVFDERIDELKKKDMIIMNQLKNLRENNEISITKIESKITEYNNIRTAEEAKLKNQIDTIDEKLSENVNKEIETHNEVEAFQKYKEKNSIMDSQPEIDLLKSDIKDLQEKYVKLFNDNIKMNKEIDEAKNELEKQAKANEELYKKLIMKSDECIDNVSYNKEDNSELNDNRKVPLDILEKLETLGKLSQKNSEEINGINNTLKPLESSHSKFIERIELLEKHYANLKIILEGKFTDCAKEFQDHREAIIELSNHPCFVKDQLEFITKERKPKMLVENLIESKHDINSQINIKSHSKSVDKEIIIKEEEKKTIVNESSEVFMGSPKLQSEYESDNEREQINLSPLILKTPNRAPVHFNNVIENNVDLTIGKTSPYKKEYGSQHESFNEDIKEYITLGTRLSRKNRPKTPQ